jgi:hypothetical protein
MGLIRMLKLESALACVLYAGFWLPVGISGYGAVTRNPEDPWETEITNKKIEFF